MSIQETIELRGKAQVAFDKLHPIFNSDRLMTMDETKEIDPDVIVSDFFMPDSIVMTPEDDPNDICYYTDGKILVPIYMEKATNRVIDENDDFHDFESFKKHYDGFRTQGLLSVDWSRTNGRTRKEHFHKDKMITTDEKNEFRKKLEMFDWYYDYIDGRPALVRQLSQLHSEYYKYAETDPELMAIYNEVKSKHKPT